MSNKPSTITPQSQEIADKPAKSAVQSKVRNSTSSRNSSQCASPTKSEEKKIPPIKAPVGLAKGPDLKGVKSKIGSLQNVKHKPCGGERKVVTQKLEWNAKSRVGSLENTKHKAGGGGVKVQNQKLEWKVASKIGSLDNVKHKPGGGDVKIFDEKYTRSSSELGSPHPLRSPSPASSTKSAPKSPSASVTNNSVNGNTLPEKVSALSLDDQNSAQSEQRIESMNECLNESKTNGLTVM